MTGLPPAGNQLCRGRRAREYGRLTQGAVLDLSELTDEQLAAETVREGSDGPAFVELLSRFRERIWRICFRLMQNETDANDAAQEVFVRLFVNRAKFEGRSKYSTWAHAVAVRTCLSIRRGKARRRKYETDATREFQHRHGDTQPTADPGLSIDLMSMLESLGEDDRAMLIMKYAEGHSYEELSGIFDLSISGCKMRVSRAREKLRQLYPNQLG